MRKELVRYSLTFPILPGSVFDYIEGGGDDEVSLRRNRSSFDDWTFLPKWGSVDNLDLRTTPTLVATDIADVAVSWFGTCALTTSGRLLCTGKNEHGEIGDGNTERPLVFTDVTPLSR